MGWTGIENTTRAEVITDLTKTAHDTSRCGNIVYALFDSDKDGSKFIAVIKLQEKRGEVFYKIMSECDIPYYFDCPERILKKSEQVDENSLKWREMCRQHWKNIKESKELAASLKPGDIFLYNGNEIEYRRPWKKSSVIGFNPRKNQEFRYMITSIKRKEMAENEQ